MLGYYHSFESMAARDGLGLRCAVFLAGCPLRCVYCHNPDTWEKGNVTIESEALVQKILRFRPYFGDEGGVTFTGGEPLLQEAFLLSCAEALTRQNVRYAVDTAGSLPLNSTRCEVLRGAQTVLLDLKFWDEDSYQKYTSSSLTPVLTLLDFLEEEGISVHLKTVIVPELNDREEILDRYLSLVSKYHCVQKYELLPFHTMGFFKYEELGIENPLIHTKALPPERWKSLQAYVDAKK